MLDDMLLEMKVELSEDIVELKLIEDEYFELVVDDRVELVLEGCVQFEMTKPASWTDVLAVTL